MPRPSPLGFASNRLEPMETKSGEHHNGVLVSNPVALADP